MFITSRLIPLAPNTPSKGTWQFFSHASPNQGIDLNAMGEVVVGRDAKVSEETGKINSGCQWYKFSPRRIFTRIEFYITINFVFFTYRWESSPNGRILLVFTPRE